MSTPEPVSRRERPSKPALSRSAIVDAALEVLTRDGAEKLTIRRVAAELDTGPASLYVYVKNVTVLHALLADRLLADLDLEWDGAEPWRERLVRLLEEYVDLLAEQGELARAVMFVWPDGPFYLDLIDVLVRLLTASGANEQACAWGIDLLLQHASTSAAEWATRAGENGQQVEDLEATLESADPQRHPGLAAFGADAFTTGSRFERRRWAFEALITGITGVSA
ncbi:TetR/AcrR family transcriptional regulator [Leucobacter sp. UCMA 4100]|uniref:TetR/AcrR family transcriptional regulator n=1 Tax=Leucobacter sp. UCMA 4100 TaxID=2810534 RepID=UPI0022EA3B62|nr:TetR/AcrR family transcriptional regulator [Leucobacter sp. UCMA 4100]MDA3147181.1 TetR/AcrR family transcriptional regulator [Leucobacter sp. UCMA 4100]